MGQTGDADRLDVLARRIAADAELLEQLCSGARHSLDRVVWHSEDAGRLRARCEQREWSSQAMAGELRAMARELTGRAELIRAGDSGRSGFLPGGRPL